MKKFRKRPQAIPRLKFVSENKDKSTTGCETGSGLDGQPCKSYFPNNVQGKHSRALHGFIIDFSAVHAGKKKPPDRRNSLKKSSSNAILVKRIQKQLNFPEGDDLSDAKGVATLQPSVALSGFGKLTENGQYGSTAIQLYRKFYLGHRG